MALSPQLLLQRQMEASGSFREAVRTAQQLQSTRSIISELHVFMPTVEELATVLKLSLETIFQCLMQIGVGGSIGFDQQARKGSVPMHQAKVLDRNAQLAAQQVEPTLRKQIPADELAKLVDNCQTLRTFLRMKVEDNNDFKMAHKMVRITHEYLTEIHRLADGDEKIMFALYNAQTEDEVVALSSGQGRSGSDSLMGTMSGTHTATTKPLPKNIVAGIQTELTAMSTGKEPVAQRQSALATIADWLQKADQTVLDANYEDIVLALSGPIRTHLSEKRSAIVRAAASIVTMVAVRSPPAALFDGPHQSSKVRLVLAQWLDVLFKSVFVTVSAIANAADEAVRDVVVASAGATFTLSRVAEALKSASQAELKRKLLQYVSIALLAQRQLPHHHHLETELTTIATLLTQQLQSGDAGVRKAARTVAVLFEHSRMGHVLSKCVAMSDHTVAKAVAADKANVLAVAKDGIEAFELQWLGCGQPCTASLFWAERCSVSNASQSTVSGPTTVEANGRVKTLSPVKAPRTSHVEGLGGGLATAGKVGSTSIALMHSNNASPRPIDSHASFPSEGSGDGRNGNALKTKRQSSNSRCSMEGGRGGGEGDGAEMGRRQSVTSPTISPTPCVGLLPSIYAKQSSSSQPQQGQRLTTPTIGGTMPLSLSFAKAGGGVGK